MMNPQSYRLSLCFALTTVMMMAGCGGGSPPPAAGISPKRAADMLHAVMEADRTNYTKEVVNRLVKEQKVQIVNPQSQKTEGFGASEHWKTEHGKVPLPAQMFRMGAERVSTNPKAGFTYALLSKWPVNKQNKPTTDVETKGLDAIAASGGTEPFYGEETLGGKKYFTAVYADKAVVAACVDCHNMHKDSPRDDFKLGDVMGGVVIRIPID
ncbi:MAG: DUF3365 domain-containing protein [Phycisphaeraceae bacterium]